MKKIAILVGVMLALTSLAGAAPVSTPAQTQLALFQQRSIFHSGLTRAHTIALTFDDGPNAHTEEVLDALKKLHVKATFFIVGHMAHRNRATLARIAAEGHLLANHSAEHVFLGSSYDSDPAQAAAPVARRGRTDRAPDEAGRQAVLPGALWRLEKRACGNSQQ
jgi:peptidoglycan/xylan/chitin deacetylase (PgdA/CDA1 family)